MDGSFCTCCIMISICRWNSIMFSGVIGIPGLAAANAACCCCCCAISSMLAMAAGIKCGVGRTPPPPPCSSNLPVEWTMFSMTNPGWMPGGTTPGGSIPKCSGIPICAAIRCRAAISSGLGKLNIGCPCSTEWEGGGAKPCGAVGWGGCKA